METLLVPLVSAPPAQQEMCGSKDETLTEDRRPEMISCLSGAGAGVASCVVTGNVASTACSTAVTVFAALGALVVAATTIGAVTYSAAKACYNNTPSNS